jgi:hypothetical protein
MDYFSHNWWKRDDDDEWIPFFTLKNDDYGLPCEINAWNLHQWMKSIHKHMDAFCSCEEPYNFLNFV